MIWDSLTQNEWVKSQDEGIYKKKMKHEARRPTYDMIDMNSYLLDTIDQDLYWSWLTVGLILKTANQVDT